MQALTGEDGGDLPLLMEMRVPRATGALAAVGGAVRDLATGAGLHPDRATRFRAVIEELVREALGREHERDDDELIVRVRAGGGQLRVDVIDQGLPMTAAEGRAAPSRRLASLGFVDELHLASDGGSGNLAACAIVVGRPDPALGDEVLDASTPDASDAEAGALEFRIMTPADAVGLCRCIYRCYGYTYKDRSLYEPRHVAHAVRSGALRSVVAVAPNGDVVGHSALFTQCPGDPVPEAGKLVVDPRYRGHHVAERMAAVRLSAAADQPVAGFWAQAVTNHPSSQKEIVHFGGAEVGLLVGASPATVVMAGLDNPNEGRRTLVAMYTPLLRVARTIHVPPRHADLVAELALRLGLDRTIDGAASEPPAPTTKARVIVVPEAGLASVRIDRIGHDVLARIARELDGLEAFDLGAIHLDLPMGDAGAGLVADQLERLGFCLAAWLPNFATSGDVLRLQRVGSHPVDVEHVLCARPEGERVRDHVVADWHRVRRGGVVS